MIYKMIIQMNVLLQILYASQIGTNTSKVNAETGHFIRTKKTQVEVSETSFSSFLESRMIKCAFNDSTHNANYFVWWIC